VTAVTDSQGVANAFIVDRHVDIVIYPPSETQSEAAFSEENIPALLTRISDRLEKKLLQARTGEAFDRLLIVESGVVSRLEGSTDTRLQKLRQRIVASHANVAGILLGVRTWVPGANRWRYKMVPVFPSAPTFDAELLTALDTFEKNLTRL
jgi:hypothetical protein